MAKNVEHLFMCLLAFVGLWFSFFFFNSPFVMILLGSWEGIRASQVALVVMQETILPMQET